MKSKSPNNDLQQINHLSQKMEELHRSISVPIDSQRKQQMKHMLMQKHEQQQQQKFSLQNLFSSFGMHHLVMVASVAMIVLVALSYSLGANSNTSVQQITDEEKVVPLLASVDDFSGEVSYLALGTNEWKTVDERTKFTVGDQIKTGSDGEITIALPNSNEVRLNNNTIIEIRVIEAATANDGAQILLDHTTGEAYHRVVVADDLHPHYEVKTPHMNIEAVGTAFVSQVDNEIENSVALAIEHDIKITIANEEIELAEGNELKAGEQIESKEIEAEVRQDKELLFDPKYDE